MAAHDWMIAVVLAMHASRTGWAPQAEEVEIKEKEVVCATARAAREETVRMDENCILTEG